MGTLYLVRHGQASFGAADYDQLSDLGQRQSERLGRYWAERGLHFDAVITGTLRRHAQTWAGIARGAGLDLPPTEWPGLNEYDSGAVIRAILPRGQDQALGDPQMDVLANAAWAVNTESGVSIPKSPLSSAVLRRAARAQS